jgi:hypothetical protein
VFHGYMEHCDVHGVLADDLALGSLQKPEE